MQNLPTKNDTLKRESFLKSRKSLVLSEQNPIVTKEATDKISSFVGEKTSNNI